MSIVITVPHGVPIPGLGERTSDTAALDVGRKIANGLLERGIWTIPLYGNVTRALCDLNRSDRCPLSDLFQLSILVELGKRPPHSPIFLLDVHSYPADTDWGRGSERGPQKVRDAVVLYDHEYESYAREFTTALATRELPHLKVAGRPVLHNVNWIITTSRQHNVPALLLEVSEDTPHRDIIVRRAILFIADIVDRKGAFLLAKP